MEPMGNQFSKPDIERLGLFVEMPYMNGKGYVSPFPKPVQNKGRNLLGDGPKIKDGTTAAFFDKEFKRIFEGEALVRSKKKKAKAFYKPFLPAGEIKKHSTPGDYFGTFSGNIEAFSNVRRKRVPYKRQLANCLTKNGRKGGPGYADICLNKYPEHFNERKKKAKKVIIKNMGKAMIPIHFPQPYFDVNPYKDPTGKVGPTFIRPKEKPGVKMAAKFIPTGPAKTQGGCHDGCFDKFPLGMPDRYGPKPKKGKPKQSKITFYPQSMANKHMFTRSVLYQKTDIAVNIKNCKTFDPSYVKYLVD